MCKNNCHCTQSSSTKRLNKNEVKHDFYFSEHRVLEYSSKGCRRIQALLSPRGSDASYCSITALNWPTVSENFTEKDLKSIDKM